MIGRYAQRCGMIRDRPARAKAAFELSAKPLHQHVGCGSVLRFACGRGVAPREPQSEQNRVRPQRFGASCLMAVKFGCKLRKQLS